MIKTTTNKIIKYSCIFLLTLCLLISVLFFSGYILLQNSELNAFVSQFLSEKIHRKIEIAGKIKPIFYPYLGVEAHNVRIHNPPGFSVTTSDMPSDFAKIASLSIRMDYSALLKGKLVPKHIKIKNLSVYFIENAKGNNSFFQRKVENKQRTQHSDTKSSVNSDFLFPIMNTTVEESNLYWYKGTSLSMALTHFSVNNTVKNGTLFSQMQGALHLSNKPIYQFSSRIALIPHAQSDLEVQIKHFRITHPENKVSFSVSGTFHWIPDAVTGELEGGFQSSPTLFLTLQEKQKVLHTDLHIRGIDLQKAGLFLSVESALSGKMQSDSTFSSTGENVEELWRNFTAQGVVSIIDFSWKSSGLTQALYTYLPPMLGLSTSRSSASAPTAVSEDGIITCSARYTFVPVTAQFTEIAMESAHLLGTGSAMLNTKNKAVSGEMRFVHLNYTQKPVYIGLSGKLGAIKIKPKISKSLSSVVKNTSKNIFGKAMLDLLP